MSAAQPSPETHRRLERPWTVLGLTVLSFVLGPLVWAAVLVLLVAFPEVGREAEVYGPERPLALLAGIDVVFGLISVALMPIALRHGHSGPEAEHAEDLGAPAFVDRTEPRSALIAALVIAVLVGFSSASWAASVITMISVCSRGRRTWLVSVYAVTLAAGLIGGLATGSLASFFAESNEIWQNALVLLGLTGVLAVMLLVPVLIGMYRWSRRRRIRALQAEALTARREAAALVREEHARAEQSRAEERTRIAREMHDTLSHRLALISTYAGALDYREDLDRETVRSTARLVQQTAATASAELRTVLDVLREDPSDTRPEPDLSRFGALLDEVRATGAVVEVTGPQIDRAEGIPDTASRTLYRILQEALTNTVKHAPGAPVSIRWDRSPEAVQLVVENPLVDGARTVRSGFGLIGVDERARAVGGAVSTERTETTFRLEARIPCRS